MERTLPKKDFVEKVEETRNATIAKAKKKKAYEEIHANRTPRKTVVDLESGARVRLASSPTKPGGDEKKEKEVKNIEDGNNFQAVVPKFPAIRWVESE